MIIKGKSIDHLTGGGAAKYRAVLFYGPDEGRVRECAMLAARSIVKDLSDPFRVVSLDGAELKSDPVRLADEAAAISMTGGRRVLRLRNLSDAIAQNFADFLQNPVGDSVLIGEAGELAKSSKLRKLFEISPLCAIAACYEDNPEDLDALISGHLKQNGLSITSEAKAYLQLCLGEDRLATRQELDKLVTYMGMASPDAGGQGVKATAAIMDSRDTHAIMDISDILDSQAIYDVLDGMDTMGIGDTGGGGDSFAGKDVLGCSGGKDTGGIRPAAAAQRLVNLRDVQACIGDSTAQRLDEICDAMGLGDLAALDYRLARGFDAGQAPVALLRSAANHLMNLQLAAAIVAAGQTQDQAIRSLRPPLHFSRAASFRQQLRLWRLPLLARGLDLLLRGEAACKTTGAPDQSICGNTLLQVALLARQKQKTPPPVTPRGLHWDHGP